MLPNDWTRMQYKSAAVPSLQFSEVENRWNRAISLPAIQIANVTVSLQWRDANSVTELIKRGRGRLAVISIRGMHPTLTAAFACNVSSFACLRFMPFMRDALRLCEPPEMLSAHSCICIQLRPFLKRENNGFMRSPYCLLFVCAVVLPVQRLNQMIIFTTFGVNVMIGVSNALPAVCGPRPH